MLLFSLTEPLIQDPKALLNLMILGVVHQVITAYIVGDPSMQILLHIQLVPIGVINICCLQVQILHCNSLLILSLYILELRLIDPCDIFVHQFVHAIFNIFLISLADLDVGLDVFRNYVGRDKVGIFLASLLEHLIFLFLDFSNLELFGELLEVELVVKIRGINHLLILVVGYLLFQQAINQCNKFLSKESNRGHYAILKEHEDYQEDGAKYEEDHVLLAHSCVVEVF